MDSETNDREQSIKICFYMNSNNMAGVLHGQPHAVNQPKWKICAWCTKASLLDFFIYCFSKEIYVSVTGTIQAYLCALSVFNKTITKSPNMLVEKNTIHRSPAIVDKTLLEKLKLNIFLHILLWSSPQ